MDNRWQQIQVRLQLVYGEVKTDQTKQVVEFLDNSEKLGFFAWRNGVLFSKQFITGCSNVYVIKDTSEWSYGILQGNQFEAACSLYQMLGQVVQEESVKLQLEKGYKYMKSLNAKEEIVLNVDEVVKMPFKEMEKCVEGWCHELELVMLESDQIQKQDENITGPRAELIYWQQRQLRFEAIQAQFQSDSFKNIKAELYNEVSTVYSHFKEIEVKMMQNLSEAKDNVLFLVPLDKHAQLLCQDDFSGIEQALPVVMNIIYVIYVSSKYFCSPDRITSLLIKLTNEVLVNIKKIIAKKIKKVYKDDASIYISDLKEVKAIYDSYTSAYKQVKQKLDLQEELPKFDFSEMYIFGRLEAFCRRLNKVVEFCQLLNIIKVVDNIHMDGFAPILKKYRQIAAQFDKTVDVLDYKKQEFDQDYDLLKKDSKNLIDDIMSYLSLFVFKYKDPKFVLLKLNKFKPLQLYFNLDFNEFYDELFRHFAISTIPAVYKHINTYRNEPTSLATTLQFIQSNSKLLFLPYKLLSSIKSFENHSDHTKAMQLYNKAMTLLMSMEHHQMSLFYNQLPHTLDSLNCSIVLVDERNILHVNFDPHLHSLYTDTLYLIKANPTLKLPNELNQFIQMYPALKKQLKQLDSFVLNRNTLMHPLLPPFKEYNMVLLGVFNQHAALGFNTNWASPSLVLYIKDALSCMSLHTQYMSDCNCLQEQSTTLLNKVKALNWSVINEQHTIECSELLQLHLDQLKLYSSTFNNNYPSPQLQAYFQSLFQESLVTSIKESIDLIKQVMSFGPLLVDLVYVDNEFSVIPTPSDLQQYYINHCSLILHHSKQVCDVSMNKEISRCQSAMTLYHKQWQGILTSYLSSLSTTLIISNASSSSSMRLQHLQKHVLILQHDLVNQIIGPLQINVTNCKQQLVSNCNSSIQLVAAECQQQLFNQQSQLDLQLQAYEKIFATSLDDFTSIQVVLQGIESFMLQQYTIEQQLKPLEDQTMVLFKLNQCSLEQIDAIRYRFDKLNSDCSNCHSLILSKQKEYHTLYSTQTQHYLHSEHEFISQYSNQQSLSSEEAMIQCQSTITQLKQLKQVQSTLQSGSLLFNEPLPINKQLQSIESQLNYQNQCYAILHKTTVLLHNPLEWQQVDATVLLNQCNDLTVEFKKVHKSLNQHPHYLECKSLLDLLSEIVPLLEQISNPKMTIRHLTLISEILKCDISNFDRSHSIQFLFQTATLSSKEEIEEICIGAIKEYDINEKLQQVIMEWNTIQFTLGQFKQRGLLILHAAHLTELITVLEDSQMTLSSLFSNRYNGPFKPTIQQYMGLLTMIGEQMELWCQVQNLWIYLEAVFGGGDIAKQMPKEAKKFNTIDKTWCRLMSLTATDPLVINCCQNEMIKESLPFMMEQLEQCQKSLVGYLESKRSLFPRFYFTSDPALLEILGQASDTHTIQPHLRSLFDNLCSVQFDATSYDKIVAIKSQEGELVPLQKPMMATGTVEQWLMTLLTSMKSTIHSIINQAVNEMQDADVFTIIQKYPAQIGLLCLQISWTSLMEDALQSKSPKAMQQALATTTTLLNTLISQTTLELSKLDRVKYETLITIQVHHRDTTEELLKCQSIYDFDWLKQCRFYATTEDGCKISITNFDFNYQCEYLGCTDRLVITPLTDRCYCTLAQAMGLNLGGSPAGPAGTGKTETTKDMGKALGKWVVVFNCSDQMDYRGLGRIYKGLAQSGCWGCFDEFNRIELPVLSVAAQQISSVLNAKKEKKPNFLFTDGTLVDLNPEVGFFITMNPGYAGRVELPENLKVYFRYVAMMVPDRQIIIKVKLAGCGFIQNTLLSRKFFTLYKLCEEQLSKQVHYDFGLRNILSVLRTCGSVKRLNPLDSEELIMMRVLRDMNTSKLVDEDEIIFSGLIGDLFTSTSSGDSVDSTTNAITKAIEEAAQQHNTTLTPLFLLKCIQLFETQQVRHGLMLLGPTGSGKSRLISTLLQAFAILNNPHKEIRLNPKSVTDVQLFGKLDVVTNDWTDGIFSAIWRKTLKRKENCWIVLDGPVDAVWIENLNSVLDDNKTLTLANGDRLQMSPQAKLIFEVDSLRNASPATVSRCGMIYVGQSTLHWHQLLTSSRCSTTLNQYFKQYFQLVLDKALTLQPRMQLPEISYFQLTMALTSSLLAPSTVSTITNTNSIRNSFLFALAWGCGSLLELDQRQLLWLYIQQVTAELNSSTVIDMYSVCLIQNQWQPWSTLVPSTTSAVTHKNDYHQLFIPNIDTIRTHYLMGLLQQQELHVLLVGEPGSAKTSTVLKYCQQSATSNESSNIVKTMAFSSAATPLVFQRTLESCLEKRLGTTYGPPQNKQCWLMIDDINMPEINAWGDQPTSESVRFMMEQHSMYSLDKPGEQVHIVDLHITAAMTHGGNGRNELPNRLKRQFSILNCAMPSDESILQIFQTILGQYINTNNNYNPSVIQHVKDAITMIKQVWSSVKQQLIPTPDKFHYTFNLRDLSRIIQGLTLTSHDTLANTALFNKVIYHECCRVLMDRLISEQDVKVVKDALVVTGTTGNTSNNEEERFCHFMQELDDSEQEPKYIPFTLAKIRVKLLEYQQQYNESVKSNKLDLVLFDDAIDHICRICRVLNTNKGNMVLVGVGGSGKQSLVKLSAFICQSKCVQLQMNKNYGLTHLLEDVKLMTRAAGFGQRVTWLFTDNDIKDESFLGILNTLLTSGDVPNLFTKDELLTLYNDLRPLMKKDYPLLLDTNDQLYAYFIQKVQLNLHIIVCTSPVGDSFRNRSLKYPGLISGCTLNWFNKWPFSALVSVSSKLLAGLASSSAGEQASTALSPSIIEGVVQVIATIHQEIQIDCNNYKQMTKRSVYCTPKSYLSFIHDFMNLYRVKYKDLVRVADRMQTGLNKLEEASINVSQLQQELTVKEQELLIASKEADVVLIQVTLSTEQAQVVKDNVYKVKQDCQLIATTIHKDKSVAEGELEAAKPALEEAANALNSIQPSHISSVRKLAKPPHLIMRIMDGVLLLQQKKIDVCTQDPERSCVKPSWQESMKLMSTPDFLSSLLKFQKDEMTEECIELIEPLIEMPDFTTEGAKKVSADVAGLACWVRAMATYYHINKKVVPLKANLIVQEHKYKEAMAQLNAAQLILDEKEGELNALKKTYDEAISSKMNLESIANSCRKKMSIATQLINGLQGEKERWTITNKELQSQLVKLVGDVLLCSAFKSYCGPFNYDFRNKLVAQWKGYIEHFQIPISSTLQISQFLTTTLELDEWVIQGLPNDDLSIQNGIITTQGSRTPLLIDPQNQAKSWLLKREPDIVVTQSTHKYFRNHVEDAMNLGKALLIEIEDQIDPSLDNILEKNLIKSGKGFKVVFGDKELDYSAKFKCYMTTKSPNPSFNPETFAKTSVVDFTVTIKGLEEQLLGRVILKEKKELEIDRVKLLEEISSNKKKVKDLEDNLLQRLSSTKGSLVDDESLVIVLETTKKTSIEVNEKLIIAAETNKKITFARDEYRVIAIRGSILYFLISDFSNVCNMYATSLKQFLFLFDSSLLLSTMDSIVQKRIDNIMEYMTFKIYSYFTRGLFEKHKLMFTLLLSLKIELYRNKLTMQEFNLFVRAGDLNKLAIKKPFMWLTETVWMNLCAISSLPQFQELLNSITNNEKLWKAWYESDTIELQSIPTMELQPFHHMLLIRCFCIDKVLGMANKYIVNTLGARYKEPILLNLQDLLTESSINIPMIALLTSGSDPTNDIENLSRQLKIPLHIVSMGQGQEIYARQFILQAKEQGHWVLLQNSHLGLPFMDELISGLQSESHQDYRLWMTTEPHVKFPILLLQQSIKFTNEPPQGLKAGLIRTYQWLSNEQLDQQHKDYTTVLFILSLFHSIVQERRKYGSIGWIIPYEFNQADLIASIMCFQMIFDQLDAKQSCPWPMIKYMVGDVHYGGRVTNTMDRRFIQTLTNTLFNDQSLKNKTVLSSTLLGYKQAEQYCQQLALLKNEENSQCYGLSLNATILCHTNVVTYTLEQIRLIQPQDTVQLDSTSVLINLINESLGLLPSTLKFDSKKFSKPFMIFIQHELQQYNALITRIEKDLLNLVKVMEGTSLMTLQIQILMTALMQQQLPKEWQQIPVNNYMLFFSELKERQQHYINWMQGKLIVIHMPYIFQPQSLLTTIQQEMSRNNKWALDTTSIHCEVAKSIDHLPTEGCYIGGFTLECGSFNKINGFTELTGKQLTSQMPVLHMVATNQLINGQVPVYRTSKRHELICLLDLKWNDSLTLKGTALVCNSDLK